MSRTKQILGLIGWLTLALGAAAVGAFGSVTARGFYETLVRPSWAPPGWLFGPVWSALYVLMGVAAWLVWKRRGFAGARWPLGLFVAQLAVNALWSWLFFAWRRGGLAFAEIVVLWALVAATIIGFRRVQPAAAGLMLPYLAWVTFAGFLCFTVWQLNPGLL